jgi:PKD repeat protein
MAEAALAPLADTFKLHSRPSARRIIYLDFNGHVISGAAWNSTDNGGRDIVAPAWDMDGSPGTFSDVERTRIQQIWQRVAEDFAPFDVDVTTELASESLITRSSSSDEYYGTRVLISPISSYFGSYGGIAYVGAFDDVGDYYKPALVFPENLGPNGEKYIAEAITHEAGHNLGLNHDGTTTGQSYYSGHGSGTTGWAPIMGAGYYQNLTQWSKGEYANANNKQDDLAVMQTYGLPHRADDHGNTAASASYFPAGSQISAQGVIERNTDVDVLAFTTGAGVISLAINATDLGPNLDVLVELRDAGGTLLAVNNPADQVNAIVYYSVAAGTYFLHVRGSGKGDPLSTGYSSYGSLGQYSISGTVVDPGGAIAPVANATATPTSGSAPLLVQFNGSSSFDQDGSIVSYVWNFGDGTSGSGTAVSHTYSAAGNYTATLTVTDNSGLTGTASVAIQVQGLNAAPVARATASPTSGTATLPVTFDGTTSTDADGSIVSYQWNFGDGTTGSDAVVQHTYQSAGTYTATLTVTDNAGASANTTVQVQVAQNPAAVIRVQTIALAILTQPSGKSVQATVRVTDPTGNPISGATVNGSFNNIVSGPATATTDANGNAVLTSKRSKKSGTVTFTVTGLAKSGYTYDASQNLQTSATIALSR